MERLICGRIETSECGNYCLESCPHFVGSWGLDCKFFGMKLIKAKRGYVRIIFCVNAENNFKRLAITPEEEQRKKK